MAMVGWLAGWLVGWLVLSSSMVMMAMAAIIDGNGLPFMPSLMTTIAINDGNRHQLVAIIDGIGLPSKPSWMPQPLPSQMATIAIVDGKP